MKLNKLLFQRSDDGILEKLFLMHPREEEKLPLYKVALHELRDTKLPKKVDPFYGFFCYFWIHVHKNEAARMPAEWIVEAEGIPILGLDLRVAQARTMSWDMLLIQDVRFDVDDRHIEIDTLKEDEQNDVLAAILYEMTRNGFSNKGRESGQETTSHKDGGHK